MGSAYASREYLECLAEFGEPVWLSQAGGGYLRQPIPGSDLIDGRGAYPLMACESWESLAMAPEDLVSLVAVPDPLSAPSQDVLHRLFPDLCQAYKEHYWVDLRSGAPQPNASHRRMLRKAASQVEVEIVDRPLTALDDWCRLYSGLTARHEITGIARFSRSSFERQLSLGGLLALRAWHGSEPVAMTLWLQAGQRAYYHLGASSVEGYSCGASYALFDRALRQLAAKGTERVLLGAGAGVASSSDGLARFKAGWATGTLTAHLCGRILDRSAYELLSQGHDKAYFPAYRDPSKTAQAMTYCPA